MKLHTSAVVLLARPVITVLCSAAFAIVFICCVARGACAQTAGCEDVRIALEVKGGCQETAPFVLDVKAAGMPADEESEIAWTIAGPDNFQDDRFGLAHLVEAPAAGSYDVRLEVRIGGLTCPALDTTVVLRRLPKPEFTWTPDPVCDATETVVFTSIPADPEAVDSIAWGGNVSGYENPLSATFEFSGPNTVTLTYFQRGCRTPAEMVVVDVGSKPAASGTVGDGAVCGEGASEAEIAFSGELNEGATAYQWLWHLPGTGDTLRGKDAVSQLSEGAYQWRLWLRDLNNRCLYPCDSGSVDVFLLQAPEPAFTFAGDTFLCVGASVTLDNTTADKERYATEGFAFRGPFIVQNQFVPRQPGKHELFLEYADPRNQNCRAQSVPVVFEVEGAKFRPNADAFRDVGLCALPHVSNFYALGAPEPADGYSFKWVFVDAGSGDRTESNWIEDDPNYAHTFGEEIEPPKLYNVGVVARSPNGCVDSMFIENYVRIAASNVEIDSDPQTICFSETNAVTVSQQTAPRDFPFNYYWSFRKQGAGGWSRPMLTYEDTARLRFPTVGLYDVRVESKTHDQCPDEDVLEAAVQVNGAVVELSADENRGCAPFTTTARGEIKARYPEEGPLRYAWSVANEDLAPYAAFATPDAPESEVTFSRDGAYFLQLEVLDENTGCATVVRLDSIVVGVRAEYATDGPVCRGDTFALEPSFGPNVPQDYAFNAYDAPGGETFWEYGPGGDTLWKSVLWGAGPYNLCLEARFTAPDGGQCADTACLAFEPKGLDFDFETDPPGQTVWNCINNSVPVRLASFAGTPDTLYWFWGDHKQLKTRGTVAALNLGGLGYYDVTLALRDDRGCVDTLRKAAFLEQVGPYAGFASGAATGCEDETVSFEMETERVDSLEVSFGDGTVEVFGAPNIPAVISHVYSLNGLPPGDRARKFDILLFADEDQCQLEYSETATISRKPVPSINLAATQFCAPAVVPLAGTALHADTLVWRFPGFTTDTLMGETAELAVPQGRKAPISVALRAANAEGCETNAATEQIYVLPPPLAEIVVSRPDSCPRGAASFEANMQTPSDQQISFYEWQSGDGETANAPVFDHEYAAPGSYWVELIAEDESGCRDTAETSLEVRYPNVRAGFTADLPELPDTIYFPPAKTLRLESRATGATQLEWLLPFGATAPGAPETYAYELPRQEGVYEIGLVASDAEQCRDTAFRSFRLAALYFNVPSVFTPNGDGVNDFFAPQTPRAENGLLLVVYDRTGRELARLSGSAALRGWDGRSNGAEAPEGAYFYYLQYGQTERTGTITLLR